MSDKERRDEANFPILPFDPRLVGPLDLLRSALGRVASFCSEHSRELLAAGTLILIVQMVLFAWQDIWFLSPPRLPNWLLVGIGGLVFTLPYAPLVGIVLAKALYKPNTVTLSVQDPANGDQEIEHVSMDLFESLEIRNQNGETRKRDYLETVRINGRRAYEVDSFDPEAGVVVASSMAGRTNSDVRADRIAIRNIKTEMEKKVDEAMELKIRVRDLVRQQTMEVANHVIRTMSGVQLPDGESLHDRLQESIEDVDPLDDLHSDDLGTEDDESDADQDGDDRDSEQADLTEQSPSEDLVGIFARAAEQEKNGGAPADD